MNGYRDNDTKKRGGLLAVSHRVPAQFDNLSVHFTDMTLS